MAAAAAKRIADVDAAVARRLSVWTATTNRRTVALAAVVSARLFYTDSDKDGRTAARLDNKA